MRNTRWGSERARCACKYMRPVFELLPCDLDIHAPSHILPVNVPEPLLSRKARISSTACCQSMTLPGL
ncbi:hypothetical protein BDV35DRAFT_359625 [Aspergillus flavus]|uniref:Uncharacterized protein n=1 Tax=Aspergillus flavus TaxID=5059 RepID=A0A5N6GRX4_ASPFL|nr:hypothetical protein BDV35DRAFT_359625 [Aspergillus flavus]